MRFPFLTALAVVACVLAAGCQFPRDPEGTLDRVTDGTIEVGVTENPPWVRVDGGEPTGVEPELLRRFAETRGATIEWVHGSETVLVEALGERRIDVALAGLTARTTWRRDVALTAPYFEDRVIAAVRGENAFLVALDRFLLDHRDEAERLLAREDGE